MKINIPNYQPLHKDETVYSWLLRNAFHNCIPGSFQVSKFANSFLYEGVAEHSHRLDYLSNLNQICSSLADEYKLPSPDAILKENTGFHIHSIAYKYGNNALKAQYLLNANTCGPLSAPRHKAEFHSLKYCSECVCEDIKLFGHPYFHTVHQLPGICVCPIHNTNLIEITPDQKDKGDDFNQYYQLLLNQRTCSLNTDRSEFAYAQFVQKLHRFAPQIDRDDAKKIIQERLAQLGFNQDFPYGDFCSLSGASTYPLFANIIHQKIHSFLVKAHGNITESIQILAFLFDSDFDSFSKAAKRQEAIRESLLSGQILKYNKVLSPFSSIIKVKCNTCGNTVYAHSYACSIGYSCPDCLKKQDPTQFVNRSLKTIGDGHYSLAAPFKGFALNIIRHDTCGSTKKATLTEILFEKRVCRCEVIQDIEDIQKIISSIRDDMVVTKYYFSTKICRTIHLKHVGPNGCGLEFSVLLPNFKPDPYCRCCENKTPGPKGVHRYSKVHYIKNAEQQARDLVGNEYKLLDYAGRHGRFHILHNRCGTVTELNGTTFWFGARCRLCTSPISKDKLRKIVYECTSGTCTVGNVVGNNVEIKTGTSSFCIAPSYLVQELARPTPSSIIPGIVKRYVPTPTPKSDLYLEIKDWCQKHRIWDQRQSQYMLCNNKIGKPSLRYLTQTKYIYSYDYNFYSIYPDVTVEDMIIDRYLLTETGESNGIYSGASLAYRLNLISTCPDIYFVYSNVRFNKPCRTVRSMNCTICLSDCRIRLTANNKTNLECIELIRWACKDRSQIQIVAEYFKSVGIKSVHLKPFMKYYGRNINIVFDEIFKKYLK